jgi:hypothetical protein
MAGVKWRQKRGSTSTSEITTGSSASRTSLQMVVSTLSSPPTASPNPMSSRTPQAIQRSSVTRAMAAKPMPVVLHTTSRMVGTASMRETRSTAFACSSDTNRSVPPPYQSGAILAAEPGASKRQAPARRTNRLAPCRGRSATDRALVAPQPVKRFGRDPRPGAGARRHDPPSPRRPCVRARRSGRASTRCLRPRRPRPASGRRCRRSQ